MRQCLRQHNQNNDLASGFEALERGDIAWDDMVTISERAWSQNVEGSKMFL